MIRDVVKLYISDYLITRLQRQGLSEEQIHVISEDVSIRLRSLLACWHNQDYLHCLFEIVKEEALFYEPKSHISIRSLVVMGIRNSSIEDIHSTQPFHPLLKMEADHFVQSSTFIREVTAEAISFFKSHLQRSDNFSSIYQNTVFNNLDKRYPRAWGLLVSTRSRGMTHSSQEYSGIPDVLEQMTSLDSSFQESLKVVMSGIDPRLDDGLLKQLTCISEDTNSVFFTPSFKHISRNIEKVLTVLEILAYLGVPIVTLNYLCTAEKVSVRKPLLKPIHNNHELKKVLMNMHGVTKDHARFLRNIAKNVSSEC